MLGRIWTAYTVEIWKAIRLRQTYAGLALVLLLVIGSALFHGIASDGRSDYSYIAYVTPVAVGLVGVLLLLIYSAGLVSQELGSGSIRMVLVRPLRRHEYLCAKLMMGYTYAVLLLAVTVLGSWGLAFALGDLTGVNFGGELLFSPDQMLLSYILGTVLALAPLIAAASYGILISTLTRNPVSAALLAVSLWVAVDILKYPLGIDRFIFSSYIERPWQVFINRCDGIEMSWFPMTWQCLGVSSAYTVVFSALAMLVLHRRNFGA